MPDAPRHPLLQTLRITLAIALLAFIILQVHWQDYTVVDEAGHEATYPGVLSCLTSVSLIWLAAAFIVSLGSMVVAGLRWRLLLAVQGVRISITEMISLQFLGEFFSTVIPGLVGGDLVKAYCVMRKTPKKPHVLMSVFLDRLLGICAMIFTAVVMLLLLWAAGPLEGPLLRYSLPSVAIVLAGTCAALAFAMSPALRRRFHLQKLYAKLPLAHHVEHAGAALERYRQHPKALVQAFLLSMVAQALNTAYVLVLGVGLALSVPWLEYFLHVPLIMIISAVPITPGAIGVMEELYILYFADAGDPSRVLALAVLVRALTVVGALPGGVVAAFIKPTSTPPGPEPGDDEGSTAL